MATHELKTDESFFNAVLDGRKTFEIRYNDRGYQTGDILILRETPHGYPSRYTGRKHKVVVTYILNGFHLDINYIAMAIKPVDETEVK